MSTNRTGGCCPNSFELRSHILGAGPSGVHNVYGSADTLRPCFVSLPGERDTGAGFGWQRRNTGIRKCLLFPGVSPFVDGKSM